MHPPTWGGSYLCLMRLTPDIWGQGGWGSAMWAQSRRTSHWRCKVTNGVFDYALGGGAAEYITAAIAAWGGVISLGMCETGACGWCRCRDAQSFSDGDRSGKKLTTGWLGTVTRMEGMAPGRYGNSGASACSRTVLKWCKLIPIKSALCDGGSKFDMHWSRSPA